MSFSKFNSKKVTIDGHKFDSRLEAEYYSHLKANGIEILEMQPKIYLSEARILYKPDFLIEEDEEKVYIDVKGMQTPVFNIKKKLWKYYGLGKLILVKKDSSGWFYSDIIYVEGKDG